MTMPLTRASRRTSSQPSTPTTPVTRYANSPATPSQRPGRRSTRSGVSESPVVEKQPQEGANGKGRREVWVEVPARKMGGTPEKMMSGVVVDGDEEEAEDELEQEELSLGEINGHVEEEQPEAGPSTIRALPILVSSDDEDEDEDDSDDASSSSSSSSQSSSDEEEDEDSSSESSEAPASADEEEDLQLLLARALAAAQARSRAAAAEKEAAAALRGDGGDDMMMLGSDDEDGGKKERPIPGISIPQLPPSLLSLRKKQPAKDGKGKGRAGEEGEKVVHELDTTVYEAQLTRGQKSRLPRKQSVSEAWASLPTIPSALLPQMKRDYQALGLKAGLDPKRFMKGSGGGKGKVPESFAIGTLINPPKTLQATTLPSERRYIPGQIVGELVGDAGVGGYAKRKFGELQGKRMENGRGQGWKKRKSGGW